MASVDVPSAWIAQAWLPGVCARHGGPATSGQSRKFYTRTPLWVLVLLPFTLMITLLVSLAIRETVEGKVPACARCVRDRRNFIHSVWAGWLVDLLLIVVAAAAPAGGAAKALIFLWLAVTAFMLYWSFAEHRHRVTGRVSKDQQWVELLGAHEKFVVAVNEALRAPYPSQPAMANAFGGSSTPAHWASDPTGRHQLRWWDGNSWTAHVHDNGVTGIDR